jgi:transposase
MSSLAIDRLDHHGVVSGIIDDLKLVEIIDQRIPADEQSAVSAGEAVKAMIINGLGFCNKPLMLTPQFYDNLPMELLFRPGVEAQHFNRHKLGRTLDEIHVYGCDTLFSELALSACDQEGVERRNNSLDTTSFSLTGAYEGQADEQAIAITYGHSKDHRGDLKQAVQEMLVSQDGGVPLFMKSHDGNASDSVIFRQRAEALVEEFKRSEGPRYLIADSKLYAKKGAEFLSRLRFITRVPSSLKLEQEMTQAALAKPEHWVELSPRYRYQRIAHTHYGIEQRWLVVYSDGAYQRAGEALARATDKERESLEKEAFHLQAQRFASREEAENALNALARTAKYHRLQPPEWVAHKRYTGKGRPAANRPVKTLEWQVKAGFLADDERLEALRQTRACFTLATNISADELDDAGVFQTYKNQSSVEHGFRFLKDPLFFVSSLFLKKPSRLQALLMVMTLSLLVYTIAQRRMRARLAQTDDTLPNQIGTPTQTPTLRWVFQILEGIHHVTIGNGSVIRTLVDGLTNLRIKILRLFGQTVCRIYQISLAMG